MPKKIQNKVNTIAPGRVTYNGELLAVTLIRCHRFSTRYYGKTGSFSVYYYAERIAVTEISSRETSTTFICFFWYVNISSYHE